MPGEEGALRRNAGEMMWMDSRPRLYGGGRFAGKTEGGMGPRMREDNEGKGSEIPRLRFASLGMTCGGSGEE